MKKYIFVVGGVISGLGKGITSASIARLLKDKGYKVTNVKIDAYVNVDAGTMNPTEHGEVFVTDDGLETDQDIGNYERFLNQTLTRENYTTTGKIYQSLIKKERNLYFGGKCVEVVPHIPLEIIDEIDKAIEKNKAEIVIVEIGGTIGEYQNILFIEAARMLKYKHPKDVLITLVSYIPIPKTLGEMKTKPTQYASRTLNGTGIQADFIICRGEKMIDKPRMDRLALLCNMKFKKDIISAPDVENIYEVPLILKKQGIVESIIEKLHLPKRKAKNSRWADFVKKAKKKKKKIKIGIVGKYFATGDYVLTDSYVSVIEAVKHGCWTNNLDPEFSWINADDFDPTSLKLRRTRKNPKSVRILSKFDGVVVPQGWGSRGTEGKIKAIQYLRENKIPYLGLCFGMQMAVIEFARNVLGLKNANSEEVNPKTKHPVIHIIHSQKKYLNQHQYGGTIRLGAYPCKLNKDSILFSIYKNNLTINQLSNETVSERHRHRYEFNNKYRKQMEEKGLIIAGTSPDNKLVEAIELPRDIHPFFVGVQFHPEYKSRPLDPHPIFVEFIKAAKNQVMKNRLEI